MEVKFENIEDEFNFVNTNINKLKETDTKNYKEFKTFQKRTNKNVRKIDKKFQLTTNTHTKTKNELDPEEQPPQQPFPSSERPLKKVATEMKKDIYKEEESLDTHLQKPEEKPVR